MKIKIGQFYIFEYSDHIWLGQVRDISIEDKKVHMITQYSSFGNFGGMSYYLNEDKILAPAESDWPNDTAFIKQKFPEYFV